MAGKATITSGLLLRRSAVLKSLRHYLRAQSQGHHTVDSLEERGVERGFLERTRAGHRESDEHWIGFKGDVGETSERCGGAHMDFFESMDTILNRTELTRQQRQPLLVLLTTTSQQLRRSSGEGRHI